MPSKCRESESCYGDGCRSDLWKKAAADARRERRRRAREAVGELPASDIPRTRLVSITSPGENSPPDKPPTSGLTVSEAVSLEISGLGASTRPGLAAAAMSLAALLDNPRATSSKPAAAGALTNILNQLRKSAQGGKPKLASVRQMSRSKVVK